MLKKYRMLYDENLCIGCQACNIACRVENGVSDDFFRLQVRIKTKGTFPSLSMNFFRQACVMCDNPPCVSVCPTHASFLTKEGLTLIDERLCISCKYCVVACPYNAHFINPITKTSEKCTFCFPNRVSKEMLPACVSVCPTDALAFGDMNDKNALVYQKSQKNYLKFPKEHLQTFPKVAIIPNKKGIK